MARQNLPDTHAHPGIVRRIVSTSPIVVGVYAVASLALGFGFANPAMDAMGVIATTGGYLVGEAGIRRITSTFDGLM